MVYFVFGIIVSILCQFCNAIDKFLLKFWLNIEQIILQSGHTDLVVSLVEDKFCIRLVRSLFSRLNIRFGNKKLCDNFFE